MNYVQIVKDYIPNYVMRSLLSEVDSRSPNQKFYSFFVIEPGSFFYPVHPLFITVLNQFHAVDIPIPCLFNINFNIAILSTPST